MEFFEVISNRHSIRTFTEQPLEEDKLQKAYGEQYGAYRQTAKKLIPFVY